MDRLGTRGHPTAAMGGSVRLCLSLAAALAMLVASACSTTNPKPTPKTTGGGAAVAGITTEGQLLTAIRTQGLTPERAEQLFVLDVGPLPGVSASGIKSDGGFDGTVAVMDLYAEFDHLTKAQRDAATRLITSSHTQSSAASTTAWRTAGLDGAPRESSAGRRASGPHAVLLGLTNTPAFDYLALAEAANTQEATATGTGAIAAFVIDVSDAVPLAYAETTLFHRVFNQWEQWPDGCHITVWDLKFQGLDAESAAAIMAHEVFHCFQQSRAGSGPNAVSVSPWIIEGEATWVMDQLHPSAVVVTPKWFRYAFTPATKYVDRSYDALGVFGHQGDMAAGGQSTVWLQLLPVDSAGIGGNDSAALSLLMSSNSNQFYSTWGGSYYEDQAGTDWHMAGPGTPPTGGPSPRSVTIANGDAQEIGLLGPYQAAQTTIDTTADILVVNLTSGYGKAHDSGYTVDKTLDTSAPLALCVKQGGCKCPDGSPGASEHTIPATSPISVGLDGGDQSLAAYASGDSLDKFCKQPDNNPLPPGPPGPSGGGGGGSGGDGGPETPMPSGGHSRGDPHLTTFDGALYDLQAAGEFTLVQSTSGDLVVQVRAVPLVGSHSVAANAAVAAKVDGHRVTLTLQNLQIIARVDGVVMIGEQRPVGSGTLQRSSTEFGAGYLIEWADGTKVHVDQFGKFGVNVTMTPAAARKAQLAGLLGNDNGNAADDLAFANGTSVGASPTPQTLNGPYADSWRVTQATSLFDYGPGQSTATFTNRSFPSQNVDASNAPNAATLKQECQAEGITDTYLLQDCIIDASATHGDQSVLSHYAQAQTVMTVQAALAHNLPPFPPPSSGGGTAPTQTGTPAPVTGALNTIIDSGIIADSRQTQSFTFQASAGDIIFIGFPQCDDGNLVFALVDPNGKTLNPSDLQLGLRICLHGRFALTVTGTYTLVANVDMKGRSTFGVPIRFDRHDQTFQTSYGQTVSGYIPDQATQDIYSFSATAGDILHLHGDGCTIGPANRIDIVGIDKPDGTPVAGVDCSLGSAIAIPQTGTYELVINSGAEGPFPYHLVLQQGQ